MAVQRTFVFFDPANEQLVIHKVDPTSGNETSGYPTVKLSLADVAALGLTNQDVRFRTVYFYDADNNCIRMKFAVPCTLPEPA